MVDLTEAASTAIISAVVSGIVSLLVGFAAYKWYGPGRVTRENKKRDHSVILVKEVLAPWLHDPDRYCQLGVGFKGVAWGDFSPGTLGTGGGVVMGRGTGYEVRDPIDPPLEYFKEFVSHLEMAYQDVLIMWGAIKGERAQYNREVHGFLDSLGREVFERTMEREPLFHWNGQGGPPESYCLPEDTIFMIWKELKERAAGGPNPSYQMPVITEFSNPKGTIYEISWKEGHPPLMRTRKKEVCQEVVSKIAHLCDSPVNIDRARNYTHRKQQLQSNMGKFRERFQEIKSKVDLGGSLKGKCTHCP